MKARKITVKRVNKETSKLPTETMGCDLMIFRTTADGKVVESKKIFNHAEMIGMSVYGYSHYIVLPRWLR